MKATYGVYGMMEWAALIPAGNTIVRVRFSGGSLSGYGTTPATFTTTNAALIKLIRDSRYFKNGKIRIVRMDSEAQKILSGLPEVKDRSKEEYKNRTFGKKI